MGSSLPFSDPLPDRPDRKLPLPPVSKGEYGRFDENSCFLHLSVSRSQQPRSVLSSFPSLTPLFLTTYLQSTGHLLQSQQIVIIRHHLDLNIQRPTILQSDWMLLYHRPRQYGSKYWRPSLSWSRRKFCDVLSFLIVFTSDITVF